MVKRLIFFVVPMVVVIGIIIGHLLVTQNYHKLYDMREIKNGVMDFAGYAQKDSIMYNSLSGEWEMFYNRWVVTDGFDGGKDGDIKLPGRWTDKKNGGMDKSGYASFRIRAVNIAAGERVSFTFHNYPYAFKIFINGVLVNSSGNVSKNPEETFCTGFMNEAYPYTVSEGETLEIVVELSATDSGGFLGTFWLKLENRIESYNNFLHTVSYITIGIVFSYVIFSLILYLAFRGKERQTTSLLLMLSIFFHYLTSKEIWEKAGAALPFIDYALVFKVQFFTVLAVMTIFSAHLFFQRIIKTNRAGVIFVSAACLLGIPLYYALRGTNLWVLSFAVPFTGFIFVQYLISRACAERVKEARTSCLMMVFLLLNFTGIALDICGFLAYGMESLTSFLLLSFIVPSTILSLSRIRTSAKDAQRSAELQLEINTIKQQALKSQIKPHFIFNALTAIEALYRKDIDGGEEAMEKFAHHLRLNVEADNKDFVPFTEELENILNYFELENLRYENKLTLLLDTAYTDFNVPILSLQPLIENSVKYARTQDKEDGFIQIISKRDNGNIIIEVSDNGKGFDVHNIRKGATGLKNVSERLRLMLGAEIEILSEPDKGTTIRIIFSASAVKGGISK